MITKRLSEDFWMLEGEILYIKNKPFFEELTEKECPKYALEICGEPIFGCRLADDGDPGIETSGRAIADIELLNLFLSQCSGPI